MRGNTIVMLLIALFFGVISVFVANIWLTNRASPPNQQVIIAPAAVETSTIVVAGRDLVFGESLNTDSLREIPWPKASVPDGSYAKIAPLLADGNHIVLTSISPNEPILKWKISGAGARASLSAIVTPGMRAVAVRINDVAGVGGFVLPGDRVDILYTHNGGNGNSGEGSTTDILIQNVRVLAIDQIADQKKSDPQLGKVATIEVAALDGEKIALAQTTGSLSLTLRSAGSVDQAPVRRVVEQELVSSPSVYQTAIDAQTAAQVLLDAKLNATQAQLDSKQAQLDSKLNATQAQLDAKIKSLDDAVKLASKATGQGEEELRAKLAALQFAIESAGSSTKGEDALRAKLAEFEANLRALAASSNKPVLIPAVVPVVAPVVKLDPLMTIGITRGIKRDLMQVSRETIN